MQTTAERPNLVSAMKARYSDAYAVARVIEVLGIALQYSGLGLAFLIWLTSMAAAAITPLTVPASLGASRVLSALSIAVFGIGASIVMGTLIYLIGLLMSGQGQVLKATLDTAVNASRILSNDDCVRILSLEPPPTEIRIPVAATTT